MRIEFSSPFKKLTGKAELTLSLEHPVTLEEIIRRVARQFKTFERYACLKDDSVLTAHLTFVRSGQILLLSELVDDEDRLTVFLPVTGG